MAIVKGRGDEELYTKLETAYPSDDEESEVVDVLIEISYSFRNRFGSYSICSLNVLKQEEGDDAYLETYESDDDIEDEIDKSIRNLKEESDFSYDYEEVDSDSETELESHDSLVYSAKSRGRADQHRDEDRGANQPTGVVVVGVKAEQEEENLISSISLEELSASI